MTAIGADMAVRDSQQIAWPDTYRLGVICVDPSSGGPAEPITLRDKLACVWKQLLAGPSQIGVAVDLRSMTK